MAKRAEDNPLLKLEKRLERIRTDIVPRDKRLGRMLLAIDLAMERITTGEGISGLAKQHSLSEEKVRRYIESALFLARSRMFERSASKWTRTSHSESTSGPLH